MEARHKQIFISLVYIYDIIWKKNNNKETEKETTDLKETGWREYEITNN